MKTMVVLNHADKSVHYFYLGKLVQKVIKEMYQDDYVAWFEEAMSQKTGISMTNSTYMVTDGHPRYWEHILSGLTYKVCEQFSALPYDENMP
jgi:hypothetical protein